ncbi:MAG: glycosyltransferase family 2 protein [Candidatus Kapabacteria bacterium]|jgi:hypothetical protein|nr:glycosyltransferase family 2 protein [Candidatus Kapabacteria bacterium]
MFQKISIIIVSYNVSAIMRDCLRSIQRETATPYEIIIVDNASTDDSCAMVAEEFPDAMLIANKENQGFAKANNQGLREAKGEYLLFLNPDTIILNGAIDRMVAYLEQHPNVGLLGPHTFNADGATTQSTALHHPSLVRAFHAHIPLWRVVPFWKPAVLGEYAPAASGNVEIVKGSCMLMRTALAREIGGMNEQYFMYSEEIDLCEAVRKRKLSVYYYADASIIHLGGASTEAVSDAMAVHLYRSTKKLFARQYNNSPIVLQILRGILVIGSLWRFCAWKLVQIFKSKSDTAQTKQRNHKALLRWLLRDFS